MLKTLKVPSLIVSLSLLSTLGFSTVSSALGTAGTTAGTGANNQAALTTIISRGNTEINRRLTSLGGLSAKVTAAIKLTATDKTNLNAEVSTEITGLTSLKAKLDADTDVASAKTDAQSIFNDYRVYALVVPKVDLVKTADDQQAAEAKLTDLASKLQGKTTNTSLLADMVAKVSAAQSISSNIESTVASLQPSDYNSNHSVLSGDRDQLKTAATNLQTALSDAKQLVAAVKS